MMNIKKACLLAAGMCLSLLSQAQGKKYTIAEATNGIYTTLAPEGLKQPSWEPNTHKLYHVVGKGDNTVWVAVSFPDVETDTVLRLQELKNATNLRDLKSLPSFTWLDKHVVYFTHKGDVWRGLLAGNGFNWSKWISIPENAENFTIHKSMTAAYTVENNLWFVGRDGKAQRVTNEENKNIVSGQSVHRNEFGINGGIFLSPQGNYLAYYRMDQTMVADYGIMDWASPSAVSKNIKYPMAGGTSHEVTLVVYNPVTGRKTELKTEGPKDQYLTSVTWSPDEQYIYVAVLNRGQNHMWLNQYDARTGAKVKTLFEETDPKYVEPLHPLTFLPGSTERFVWWSRKSGFHHLYLYNTDGKLIRQLTKGNWEVNAIEGIDADDNQLIITAAKESPLEKHIYTVNWNNGKLKRLYNAAGWHNALVSEEGDYVLDVFSSADVPKRTVVLGTDGDYKHVMMEAENPLRGYDRPEIKSVTLTADDGTPLYGKLILPTNFNSNKKYPVIVYLYNGPHVQLVKNSFPESGNLWYEYLAQKGYVVFTMDGRGSSNRGKAFEQAVFRKLGTVEMQDQLKGVEYLTSLPYVDEDRMGVHGWSFGGFMTTSLMLRHPDVFKVGVAGGPVLDWSMYEVMYTERYMDTPQENPEGYATSNLLTKVKDLKGNLLIIHGTDDDVVVWQHSIKFLKNAVDENVQVDYFVYPGHPHNVRGKDRVHLMQKITNYFDQYLNP